MTLLQKLRNTLVIEPYGSDINRCIHKKRKTAYGYIWKSEEEVQRLSQACEYTQASGNGEGPLNKG